MIKFDDNRIAEASGRKKKYAFIAYVLLIPLIIGAVIAATLTRQAVSEGKYEYEHLAALGLALLSLLALTVILVFFVAPVTRRLKRLVCESIAEGLLAREDMFKGGGKIEFAVDYSGDLLTLSRKNYSGAICVNPEYVTAAEGLGSAGAKIELDLKRLKAAPAVYAGVGTKLWLFLNAYYALHGKEHGVESVTVTDNTGKTPLILTVFDANETEKHCAKNYFIDKGLIP